MENNGNTVDQKKPQVLTTDLSSPQGKVLSAPLNMETMKAFFNVTGGSSLYCLSAVLVAYGIIRVLTPVLENSDNLRQALPALLTLHIYELALLGVLLLLAFKKVVDDAVSLAVLMVLFLVGTSIAFGSVADRALKAGMYLGFAGLVISLIKLYSLKRLAHIAFGVWSILGLTVMMAYNYFGPVLMARAVAAHPADETIRRQFWLLLYILMLSAAAVTWIESVKAESETKRRSPFFNSRSMVCLLAAIVTGCSGVHQYTMAYAFSLERVLIDYVPAAAMVCLLLIELFRFTRMTHRKTQTVIAFIPLLLTLLAIYKKSVLSSGEIDPGLIGYPPVILAAIGLMIACLAFFQRRTFLWLPVFGYILGIVLTYGFSPQYPHQLNTFSCGTVLISSLVVFGLIRRNPYICLAGVVVAAIVLPMMDRYSPVMKNWQLTEIGGISGLVGVCTIVLYLIFTFKLIKLIRIIGAICLAAFIFDFLPVSIHWRYAVAIAGIAVLSLALFWRTRDIVVISIIAIPLFAKAYMLAKHLAYWRHVIVGFVLLAAGAIVSLFKRPPVKSPPAASAQADTTAA